MKLLKKVIFGLVILGLLLLYIPKHLAPHVSIVRTEIIKAPVSEVFKRLPDLNEYNKWNPFAVGDSSYTAKVEGEGVGSSLTWKSEKSGEGKMTIVSIEANHRIKIKMEFFSPMKGEGTVYWVTVPTSDGNTEFKWTFDQDLPYFNRYFGLVMDKMVGKHFENGLSVYKHFVEGSAK